MNIQYIKLKLESCEDRKQGMAIAYKTNETSYNYVYQDEWKTSFSFTANYIAIRLSPLLFENYITFGHFVIGENNKC